MAVPERVYTRSEKARKVRLLAETFRRPEGDYRYERALKEIDTINETAELRHRQEMGVWEQTVADAKAALAAARVAERAAPRSERAAATRARKDAEKRLKLAENARPRR